MSGVEPLIVLLVWFLFLAIAFYGVKIACAHFGAPGFVVQIIGLILLLIFLIKALRVLGVAVV